MTKFEIFFTILLTLCIVGIMHGFIFGGLTLNDFSPIFQNIFKQIINK